MSGSASLPIRLVVVDDHTLFRRALVALLAADGRFEVVGEAGDTAQAQQVLQRLAGDAGRAPQVMLLDNHLPGVSGVAALPTLLAAAPGLRVLMLTMSEDEHDLAANERRVSRYDGSMDLRRRTLVRAACAATRGAARSTDPPG